MATKTALTADKPRGRNQRERWYQTHARPAEELFVIELPNGSLGKVNGTVAASPDRAVMEAVVTRYSGSGGSRPGWTVRTWTFEEGVHITRLNTLADVDRLV